MLLSQKDFLIYPGKLTVADTFRIGCIGNLQEQDMHDTINAIKEVLNELQFRIEYVGLYFDFLRIVHELAYQLARWVEHWYPH